MKKELYELIKDSNLPENHKLTFKFLMESIEKNEISEFISKTFLFYGDPGIGKTYFVENMIKHLELPIIFMGPFKFEYNKSIYCKNLKDLYEILVKSKEAVVFIDDLQNTLGMEYDMGSMVISDSERKIFLSLLEHIKRTNEKKFLFITLNDEYTLEESWLDRIETRIELDSPNEKSKKLFLSAKYQDFIKKSLINEIAEKSMGYNFRNLDELIKIAYREGNGVINKKSIKIALSVYTPTSMERYHVIHKTNLKFKDVIGNEKLKKELSFLKQYIKHPKLFHKNKIERSNVLIFSGPPGTGKTYMAKALSGELDVPMISLDAGDIINRGDSILGVSNFVTLARRFRNCVIFVDELDKIIGQEILSSDGAVIGSLEAELDGIREKTKAIIILTMNDKARFGIAFHDRIPCFNFKFPSKEERKDFIISKINNSKIHFSEESIESFVLATENKSYRQIDRIWNNILFSLLENNQTIIKNNRIIAEKETIEESINNVLGFVQNTNPVLNMVE